MSALEQLNLLYNGIKSAINKQDFKGRSAQARLFTKYICDCLPTLGLDIDGTIDENPQFFSHLSQSYPGRVVIITYRKDKQKAINDVTKHGIYFDQIVLVNSLSDKARVIKEEGVKIYFDDQDECIINIPSDVTVLKVRNGGNFVDGKWLFSNETGKII